MAFSLTKADLFSEVELYTVSSYTPVWQSKVFAGQSNDSRSEWIGHKWAHVHWRIDCTVTVAPFFPWTSGFFLVFPENWWRISDVSKTKFAFHSSLQHPSSFLSGLLGSWSETFLAWTKFSACKNTFTEPFFANQGFLVRFSLSLMAMNTKHIFDAYCSLLVHKSASVKFLRVFSYLLGTYSVNTKKACLKRAQTCRQVKTFCLRHSDSNPFPMFL